MKISDLAGNPENPRTITDAKKVMLAKAIAKFGDLSGIVYNRKTKRLVGGHQRVSAFVDSDKITLTKEYFKATKQGTIAEGFVETKSGRFSYREVIWDETTEKAANIAANAGAGEWDTEKLQAWIDDLSSFDLNFDLDLTMFDSKDFEELGINIGEEEEFTGECDEDEVPVEVAAVCNLGQIWQLGEHRLMCGDSTSARSVEELMNGVKAELCFTSPPYVDQREYRGGKELSTKHLATFISTAKEFCNYFAVNLGYSRKEGEVNEYWQDYISEARTAGLKFLSWNIWDRSGMAYTVGQATAMFTIDHEWIFVFGKKANKINRTIPNKHAGNKNHGTNRQKDGSLTPVLKTTTNSHRQLGTVVRIDVERDREIKHPAKFPVAFAEAYVEAMSNPKHICLDPFGGSGSTLIACEKTNRKCFMMELDPHYCDVIIARWEKFTGKKAKLVNALGKAKPKANGKSKSKAAS